MAVGTDTLKRTPLYDRHVAAGAKLVPFAGWEMPVQYTGIKDEHLTVRASAGIFDVSHMGEIETTGPDAEAFLQRILSNDVTKIAEHGAQYSVLCKEDGGVLDDLFTYRLDRRLPDRHQRLQPREGPGVVPQAGRGLRRDAQGRAARLRDARRPGPEARGIVAGLTDGELPKRFRTARLTVAGAPDVLVCGTGYTGEDGVELLVAPEHAGTVWDAVVRGRRQARGPRRARHAAPGGLLPPLRQRPDGDPRPDRGRPRLVREGGHGLHRRRGDPRSRAPTARPRSSSRSSSPARASPARATP